MLRDIGITKLDPKVVQQYHMSGDESDVDWQNHTKVGYQLVQRQIKPSAATIVLNHHHRYDGSGYAGQDIPVLDGHRIHISARIVGLADQFDRLRYPQSPCDSFAPYTDPSDDHPPRTPHPTVSVLGALLAPEIAMKFDLQISQAIITVVPPYPPGTLLRLSDGRHAVAMDHAPTDPCRPVLQMLTHPAEADPRQWDEHETTLPAGPILNLATADPSIVVSECNGCHTADLNFSPLEIMSPHAGVY